MKDIEKISEKVEKRKQHLGELFKKDEENYDLWSGKEQIFGTHKMDVNITGTEMVSLPRRVQASLVRSKLAIHIFPPDKLVTTDATDIANQEERMHYYGFEQADERLSMIGEAPLLFATSWQAIVLGRIAVRILVYEEDGEIVWDYLPLNPRFLTFEFDRKGLAWACYETFRSPSSITSEYKKDVTEDIGGKGVSVSDYWDRKDNVTYLTKEKETLKTRNNKSGEVPIIFQPINLGPKAITTEGIQVTAWGQAIFDHVKVPFKKLNELRSIAATQAHMLAKRPTEEIYEDGTTANIEEEHLDFHAGALIKHPRSIELKPMEIADIPSSLMAMMGDISTGIQRATYADLNPDPSGHSGSALRILEQDKRDVETPREAAINSMLTRICRMVKKQIITQKLTIPVRTVVNKTYKVFDMVPEALDNDFYVRANIIRQDVYDEEASLQRAQMLMQLRLKSRADVMEQEMGEQDVPTQIIKMDMEDIEAEIPEIKLKKMIKYIMDDEVLRESVEMQELAKMLKEQLGMMVIQKQQALMGGMEQGGGGQPSPIGAGPGVLG